MERFPLPLGAWDGLRYFLWHSLSLPYNYFPLMAVSQLLVFYKFGLQVFFWFVWFLCVFCLCVFCVCIFAFVLFFRGGGGGGNNLGYMYIK